MIDPAKYTDQWLFQNRYADGRVLNVGCDSDGARLGKRPGAVNVDLHRISKIRGTEWSPNPVSVLADGRQLPFKSRFDTVVLGEILEHMSDSDALKTLEEAKAALRVACEPAPEWGGTYVRGGCRVPRIVVTVPHDVREREEQGYGELRYFAPGIPVHHPRCIEKALLMTWVRLAELLVMVEAKIDYVWGQIGTGLVLVPMTGGLKA